MGILNELHEDRKKYLKAGDLAFENKTEITIIGFCLTTTEELHKADRETDPYVFGLKRYDKFKKKFLCFRGVGCLTPIIIFMYKDGKTDWGYARKDLFTWES